MLLIINNINLMISNIQMSVQEKSRNLTIVSKLSRRFTQLSKLAINVYMYRTAVLST